MKNYRLTIDLQMDSDLTAAHLAEVFKVAMQEAAKDAIYITPAESAHIILGKTEIRTCDTFEPNRKDHEY